MIIGEYIDKDGMLYKFITPSLYNGNDYVDVIQPPPPYPHPLGTASWTFSIETRKIINGKQMFGEMPQEVIEYLDRILNLKAFW